MALSSALIDRLSEELGRDRSAPTTVVRSIPVGGGSINDCYRLDTGAGRFFLKVNSADRFPSMFEAETDGLRRLEAARVVRVPRVIASGEVEGDTYLLLEHIDGGLKTASFWTDFGRSLARLHASTSDRFGLERDNYIGSLEQVNTRYVRWEEFFIHSRLEPQVKLARDHQRIGMGDVIRFEQLYAKLDAHFPSEPPALLHGDLWSGNFLCDEGSGPVLIDPAVYYGHREMDIAMTNLFGGFDDAFYSSYNEERPLEKGWEERMDLCNLYPLLVHVNLFGDAYVPQLERALKRFV